jgi:hypothetical protein
MCQSQPLRQGGNGVFARMLTMDVKPGQASALAEAVDQTVVPTLRKFKGFRDQLTMLSPDGSKMVAMSFWDSAPEADVYEHEGWPRVLELYHSLADGTPVLSTYDLVYSTAYQIRGCAAAA